MQSLDTLTKRLRKDQSTWYHDRERKDYLLNEQLGQLAYTRMLAGFVPPPPPQPPQAPPQALHPPASQQALPAPQPPPPPPPQLNIPHAPPNTNSFKLPPRFKLPPLPAHTLNRVAIAVQEGMRTSRDVAHAAATSGQGSAVQAVRTRSQTAVRPGANLIRSPARAQLGRRAINTDDGARAQE